jgi:Leucine-rich repeat (LRR) protein
MLNFANEKKKRVYFYLEDLDELKLYFSNNSDATLIVDFDEYFKCLDKENLFKDISLIKYKKLLLIGFGSHRYNLENLKSNKYLIELVDNYSEIAYDFLSFPSLEVLRYLYVKGSCNYSSMPKLKELSLWEYPKKNLDEFLELTKIRELRFVQSKIHNINGIDRFKSLSNLFFITNKNLVFDSNVQANKNVVELYIDGCKKIDVNLIPDLFPSLEKLTIMKNGEIKELKYLLDNLKYLKELNLMGTKILENDNAYWKDYSNLKKISFLNQKNLSLKPDDFK